VSGRLFLRGGSAFDHAHDVGLLHDQKVLPINLDFGAGPFSKQHPVACFDVKRNELAAFVTRAWSCGDDLAFLRLLLGCVGDDDAVFSSPSMRRMTTRSCSGRNFMDFLPVDLPASGDATQRLARS
jgi:hypothetical protein